MSVCLYWLCSFKQHMMHQAQLKIGRYAWAEWDGSAIHLVTSFLFEGGSHREANVTNTHLCEKHQNCSQLHAMSCLLAFKNYVWPVILLENKAGCWGEREMVTVDEKRVMYGIRLLDRESS